MPVDAGAAALSAAVYWYLFSGDWGWFRGICGVISKIVQMVVYVLCVQIET